MKKSQIDAAQFLDQQGRFDKERWLYFLDEKRQILKAKNWSAPVVIK